MFKFKFKIQKQVDSLIKFQWWFQQKLEPLV